MVRRLTSERREGVFSGRRPERRKRDTRFTAIGGDIRQPFKRQGGSTGPPRPNESLGGTVPAKEQGFISRFAQSAGTTLGKFTTPISNIIGKGLEKIGIVDEFNAVTPEEFGKSTGGKILGTAAAVVGGEIVGTAFVGGASLLLGGKVASKIAPKLAPKLLKFATGGIKVTKGITQSTRAAQNLNKAFRAGKISSRDVGRISKRIDNMRISEVTEQLTQKKGIGKLIRNKGPNILFQSGIAQWYAADNMSSGSKIASTQVINQVRFGQLSKEDGLAAINRAQFFNGLAIATVVGAMAIAPPMAPLGIILLPGMIGDGVQINLNEGIVERL